MCVPCDCTWDFNNPVDFVTHSMDAGPSLSPVTPVIIVWAHEQKYHGGCNVGYVYVQQYGLPLTKADQPTSSRGQN